MTDRLSLANALADAKMDRPAAATEIFSAIHDNVATQGDLNAARTELKADIAAVKADLSRLELRLEARIDRVVVRLGSLVVVVAGLLFVALRYLPPPH
jgi:multidrug resistance efflux pump